MFSNLEFSNRRKCDAKMVNGLENAQKPTTQEITMIGTVYRTIPKFYDVNFVEINPISFKTNHNQAMYTWEFDVLPVYYITSDEIATNLFVNGEKKMGFRISNRKFSNVYVVWGFK